MMSRTGEPTAYEKAINLLLLLIFAAAGLLPHYIFSWHQPAVPHEFLLITAAMTILILGAVFETAETLLGKGRGIYAAAVFCTFPALGKIASDPAYLSAVGFTFILAVGQWMAVKAKDQDRRVFLFFLTVLFIGAGYLFSGFMGAILLIGLIFQTIKNSSSKKNSLFIAGILIACYLWGTILHTLTQIGAPEFHIGFTEQLDGTLQLLIAMPWLLWIFPALLKLHRLAFAVLLLFGAAIWNYDFEILAAVSAPFIALLAAEFISDYFAKTERGQTAASYAVPLWTALFALVGFAVFLVLHRADYPYYLAQLLASLIIAALLAYAVIKKIPRSVFALLLASGLLFGSLLWLKQNLFDPAEDTPDQASVTLPLIILSVLLLIVAVVYKKLYGKTISSKTLRAFSEAPEFGSANFRKFANSKKWSGEKAMTAPAEQFSFIIFGDMSGSEFPFSSRRGAYFVFRELADILNSSKIEFALSLGDLSTRAAKLPYRRVRTLLRHISAPLTAIPGNHDVFSDGNYHPEFFKSLFGADNASFIFGSVKFILLNDARGHIKSEQFEWLEKTLSENPSRFTLLFCHKPPFDFRKDKFYALEIREDAERLHDLLRKYKTTAVFSGHIHTLLAENKDGITYIVSGGAGSKLVSAEDRYHYLLADVLRDEIILRAKPLAETASGETLMELRFT